MLAPEPAPLGSPELPAAEIPRGPALSPSRAADFMTCPLLYRFRTIDRLPEPPTTATARGTLVHAALERLFDLPAADRTPEAARALLLPEWDRLSAAEPGLAALFADDAERESWLKSATAILDASGERAAPNRVSLVSVTDWRSLSVLRSQI